MSKEFFSTGSSHNTIAQGTTIKGDITTETDIRIDGTIVGNINCGGKIILGPKSAVTGDIIADSAEIMGTLTGNAKVKELLTLKSTARIEGDVEMLTLSVEPNAYLSGHCIMITKTV